MSKMRWADSDSDSEEEYVPPPQPDPDPEPEPEPVDHYIPPTPSSPRGGRGGWNSYGSPGGFSQLKNALPHNHHHQSSNNANQWRGGGGGQGRPYGSSGGGRPGSGNRSQSLPVDRGSPDGGGHPRDWKQMAKAASRHPADVSGTVDGSAWMAQRRAKKEQEDQEEKMRQEELKRQAEDEKRERRKSQLNALKAAMQEIKVSTVDQPVPGSSLQAAASKAPHRKDTLTASSSPVKILKRESKQDKGKLHEQDLQGSEEQGKSAGAHHEHRRSQATPATNQHKDSDNKSWRRSSAQPPNSRTDHRSNNNDGASVESPQVSETKYNNAIKKSPNQIKKTNPQEAPRRLGCTSPVNPLSPPILPKPKGELQPDGSVKFVRRVSSNIDSNTINDDKKQSDVAKNNENTNASSNSTEQLNHPEKVTNKEPTKEEQHHDQNNIDDTSFVSRGSRGSFGGRGIGRGRGRGRKGSHHNSGARTVNEDEPSVSSHHSGRGSHGGRGNGRGHDSSNHDGNSVSSNRSGRGSLGGRGRGRSRGGGRKGRSQGGRGSHDSNINSVPKQVGGHGETEADKAPSDDHGLAVGRGRGPGRWPGRGRDHWGGRGRRGHHGKDSKGSDQHVHHGDAGSKPSDGKQSKTNPHSYEIGKKSE